MSTCEDFDIASLGYCLVVSNDIDEWKSFAGPGLGMQVADESTGSVVLRMDDRAQRLMITNETRPSRYTIGWQASSREALNRIGSRLEQAGVLVQYGERSTVAQRMVGELIAFQDPVGNCLEVFLEPVLLDTPFVPGRMHSGFRTGLLGLGHVVLTAPSLDKILPFYRDILGFGISDYVFSPFHAYFLHTNKRHHSLALTEFSPAGIHHLMVEHNMLDDVGQGHDVMKSKDHEIGVTLGRHSNDLMTSFYAQSPSDFLIEIGWGGLEINPSTHQSRELIEGPSLWGHTRSWLSPEKRTEADQLCLKAAADGRRGSVNVLPDRYIVGSEG